MLNDEQGKRVMSTADIFERWHVNKFTMSTGMGVNILKGAYVKNPSTVEEMESESTPYRKLCELSNFYKRIPVKGQTLEGFARIFFSAYLRMEGYIDRFGKSVVDKPTERQIRLSPDAIFAVSGKGARETLQAERDALLAIDTPEAHELYRSIRRKSPFTWDECWLGTAGNVGYNMEIIDKRLSEINKLKSFNTPPYRIGNFFRKGGDPDGDVLGIFLAYCAFSGFNTSLSPVAAKLAGACITVLTASCPCSGSIETAPDKGDVTTPSGAFATFPNPLAIWTVSFPAVAISFKPSAPCCNDCPAASPILPAKAIVGFCPS